MKLQSIYLVAALMAGVHVAAGGPTTAPSTQPDDLEIAFTGDAPAAGQVTTRLEAEGGRCVYDPTIMVYAWSTTTTGLTTSAQPRLIWYLNKPLDQKVLILLRDPAGHTTNHLWHSSGIAPAGIHVLDLTGSDVQLKTGIEYAWTVRIVNDESDPSKDTYSSGMIRRVDSSDPAAANHCFYDAIGQAVDALSNPEKSDAAKTSVNHLLGMVALEGIDQFTVTIDKPSHP